MSSSAADASVQTWVLILSGFLVFKFGSMAVTAEDAHLWHWGLALVGGVTGWLVSAIIQRLRGRGGSRK
jgi:hypothetical protein